MKFNHKIENIINLSNGNYILKLKKNNINFNAGQFFSIGIPKTIINREYSVCSGEKDVTIDFLIREVSDGILSKQLRLLKKNDEVKLLGPYGNFYLKNFDLEKKYIFIATGTGISPFMSLIKTYPNLNYNLYHGIRFKDDEIGDLPEKNYLKFISRDDVNLPGYYKGRITNHFDKIVSNDKDSLVFLCGNSLMVTEIYDTLLQNKFKPENIFTEIFF